MKKSLLWTMALCCGMGAAASSEYDHALMVRFENRNAASTKGSNDVFLPDNKLEWHDGGVHCTKVSIVGDNDQTTQIGFLLDNTEDWDQSKHYYVVKMVNNTPRVTNRKGITVKHEVVGTWELLVFRNRLGNVVDVAIGCEPNWLNDEMMLDEMAMLDGIYVTARGDTARFGHEMADANLPGCPGNYRVEQCAPDVELLAKGEKIISFAHNRIKVVPMPEITRRYDEATGEMHYFADGREISKNEFDFITSRPTGYGGHGALLGPISWRVKPNAKGLDVTLTAPYDEEQDWRVSTFKDPEFELTWVRSNFPGYKGRWAVASVRPLTRNMLAGFDKSMLRAIVRGIDARHTRNKTYSAIEKLNKSLINTLLAEK